jgi:hypothetical protein
MLKNAKKDTEEEILKDLEDEGRKALEELKQSLAELETQLRASAQE